MKPKMNKKKLFSHILNILTIALIVECFLCSFLAVELYAENDCFNRLQETTDQMTSNLATSLLDSREKLSILANLLGSNDENPDALLQKYMATFCEAQRFSSLRIYRANGTVTYYGDELLVPSAMPDFETEKNRLPYISKVFSKGDLASDKHFYHAVPINRGGQLVGILYGYVTLDTLQEYVHCTAYNSMAKIDIIDGDTEDLLMDTRSNGTLGSIKSLADFEVHSEYDLNTMRLDLKEGNEGFFVYREDESNDWLYSCYMPIMVEDQQVNNWSLRLTVDESSAFRGYFEVNRAIMVLAICVIALMFIHVIVLMLQTSQVNKRDKAVLHKSNYMYMVQRALLNAHNNPDYIEQSLKTVADEMKAETVLLLTFSERKVSNAYYWPSKDKYQALDMIGRNIRDDFPNFFDQLSNGKSVIFYGDENEFPISATSKLVFMNLEVSNVMMSPIIDNTGMLKGTLCAVNMAEKHTSCEMLECVTYDFFMAIANIENHAIIKRIGTIDYLTKVKNRNSYESEIKSYASMDADSLWCVFVDVNGLHEVNNTLGHKAGDAMLSTVADSIKKIFGAQYTYRLGGDEFVAFERNCKDEELYLKKKHLISELSARGYYVSVGYAGTEKNERGIFDVDRVVSDAEAAMYRAKWEYYKNNNIPSERGHFPTLQKESD